MRCGGALLERVNVRRFAVILIAAMVLHGLGATEAAAQLRGLSVPSVGGGGLGGGGIGGSGLGGTALGTGSGAIGSTDQTLGSTANNVTGTVGGATSSVTGAASSTIDRVPPVNSVTNSLMGSVRNAVSTATNPAVNPNALGRNGTGQNARGSGVPPAGERRFVPNEVVVGLASNMSPVALGELARRHRLTAVESHEIPLVGITYYRWQIADGRSISDVIRALEADGVVRHAQPNYRFTLAQAPVPAPSARAELDPGAQYASAKLHLGEAHHFATGEKVLVAVIDSAIDTSHPEIIDAVADRFDAIAPMGAGNPHGTGMAGAIVARAKLMGAAPNASSRDPRLQRRRRQIGSDDAEPPHRHRLGGRPRRTRHQHELCRTLRSGHRARCRRGTTEGRDPRGGRRQRRTEIATALSGGGQERHRGDGNRCRRPPVVRGESRQAHRRRGPASTCWCRRRGGRTN
jgi:fervidolysin-like protein/subtilase family protein